MTSLALRGVRSSAPSALSLVPLLAIATFAWMITKDWIAPLSVALLWVAWTILPRREGPPVLALAFTFQWIQVTCGIFYNALTGRPLQTMQLSDYRPMVLIGLGCLAALLVGLKLGTREGGRGEPVAGISRVAFGQSEILLFYFGTTVLQGPLQIIAWAIPGLTQGLLAINLFRLGVLYLLLRRLAWPRLQIRPIALILFCEVLLGATGYFAGFREPLMLFVLVLLERFDVRKARHWVSLAVLVCVIFFTGLLWLGIRTPYRQDFESEAFAQSRIARLERLSSLTWQWFTGNHDRMWNDLDQYIDRMWAVFYPALAVARVPDVLPHEDGKILWGAVRHVLMPRLFFPNKPGVPSDSEMVRKYSDVWVAGEEAGTSIAFGYAAESYIDFGVPLMFLPLVIWGFILGRLYRWFFRLIRHRDLSVALVTVVFWLSLYLFERSWIKILGMTITMMIFLGGAVFVLDRLLLSRRATLNRKLGLLDPLPSGSRPPGRPVPGPAGARAIPAIAVVPSGPARRSPDMRS